jgi:hypothetical protein
MSRSLPVPEGLRKPTKNFSYDIRRKSAEGIIKFFGTLIPFYLIISIHNELAGAPGTRWKVAGSSPDEVDYFNLPAALWPWSRLNV